MVATALSAWLRRIVETDQGSSALKDWDRMVIADACSRQIHRYVRLMDGAAYEELSALFTEDGVLIRPSEPNQAIRGRPAILESFRARPARQTRHVVSNIEVTAETAERATASSTVVLYTGDNNGESSSIKATAVGSFEDVFQKVGGDWLFAERRGSIAMKSSV